jgi:spore maturation protein CgeB
MSKILFSLFSNINWLSDEKIDPFYDGFISSLTKQGNEVMLIRTNEFLSKQDSNDLFSYININKLTEEVKKFDPDFIIAANHHVPRCILNKINCPILIWTSDSPVWYSDKDYIKKNISRYKFLHQGWNNAHTKVCQDIFAAREDQNFCVGYATTLESKPMTIESNIIFIGTIGYTDNIKNYLKHICDNAGLAKLRKSYEQIKKSPFNYSEENFIENQLKVSDYFYALTSNNRIKTLDSISDLGLKVLGYPHNFFEVVPYSMNLAFCFDYSSVTTMDETAKLLNSSKISLNLYHAQAVTGFSWRVADIMASNSCLISPNKPDLVKFNPYIKIPTFETPEEARELCIKLLKDDVWRKDIVDASHKAIEKHGRFEHMFKTMEEIIGVKLLNNKVDQNKKYLIFLQVNDFCNIATSASFVVSTKIQNSKIVQKFMIKILKLIPKTILRKLYYFILNLKNDII